MEMITVVEAAMDPMGEAPKIWLVELSPFRALPCCFRIT